MRLLLHNGVGRGVVRGEGRVGGGGGGGGLHHKSMYEDPI